MSCPRRAVLTPTMSFRTAPFCPLMKQKTVRRAARQKGGGSVRIVTATGGGWARRPGGLVLRVAPLGVVTIRVAVGDVERIGRTNT